MVKPRRRSLKADAVVPEGAGEALPPRPARVPISADDQQAAAAEWDRAMESEGLPDLAGLLDAEVVE